MSSDGFHPHLANMGAELGSRRNRVHHVSPSELSSETAQSEGMRRFAAISGRSVGSEKIWIGETYVAPQTASGNHHHGESETAIYVQRGYPELVLHGRVAEVGIAAAPR